MLRSRVSDEQMKDLAENDRLGALCFVMLCFGLDHFYRIPWRIWRDMKSIFGRQYVMESDLKEYAIPKHNGTMLMLEGLVYDDEALRWSLTRARTINERN